MAVTTEASAAPARWTVLEVIRWTVARFTERDLATPRLDAELLVAHALGLPRVQLYVQFDRPLLPDELAAIRALIKRRQAGESVAYLVGKKEFWGIEFAVDARVLVPRPDTETLIEVARERLAGVEAPRVADVGTGSGAIALTLAKLFPAAAVFAVDISPAALEV
ncbi:MAG TPA: HemK/PrmC family methyltransferase, partial [Polyangia bacterium]|nr:HemK/PrmC family methyltransferase [Polyangia bacterium]